MWLSSPRPTFESRLRRVHFGLPLPSPAPPRFLLPFRAFLVGQAQTLAEGDRMEHAHAPCGHSVRNRLAQYRPRDARPPPRTTVVRGGAPCRADPPDRALPRMPRLARARALSLMSCQLSSATRLTTDRPAGRLAVLACVRACVARRVSTRRLSLFSPSLRASERGSRLLPPQRPEALPRRPYVRYTLAPRMPVSCTFLSFSFDFLLSSRTFQDVDRRRSWYTDPKKTQRRPCSLFNGETT